MNTSSPLFWVVFLAVLAATSLGCALLLSSSANTRNRRYVARGLAVIGVALMVLPPFLLP